MHVRTCFESSSGASFYAWQSRLRNASDWWQSACDHVFSFLLSFARKFSSKKRRLGTRECAHNARFHLSLTTWTNLVGTKTACLSHMKLCNCHLLQPEWVEKLNVYAGEMGRNIGNRFCESLGVVNLQNQLSENNTAICCLSLHQGNTRTTAKIYSKS